MRQTAKTMFESATLRLTMWYLIILMTISIAFSIGIYHLSVGEVRTRLDGYEQSIVDLYLLDIEQLYLPHLTAAQGHMVVSLLWVNLFIFIVGGLGSYFLARRTLKPIEEAHEMQSRFVSDASHELRTPLSVMTTELEVALRAELDKDEMRELLESNLEEVNKLTELSRTLLKLSTGDRHSLEYKQFNIRDIADSLAAHYDTVEVTGGKSVQIYAHKQSIEELLTILIDNANKYSYKGTKVQVKVFDSATTRRTIRVTNEGDGIAAKDLPHIFKRFYRADNSRHSEGSGLGLALAKQIVDLHQGQITASSTPGKTTTFTVTLPRGSRKYRRQQRNK